MDVPVRHEHVTLRLHPGIGLRGKRTHTSDLPSNSSTGYSWTQRDVVIPSIIKVTNNYCQHEGPPGTGGTDKWTFTATDKGEEIVKLAYAPESDSENVSKWVEICFKVE
jgi:predicted secreted protein